MAEWHRYQSVLRVQAAQVSEEEAQEPLAQGLRARPGDYLLRDSLGELRVLSAACFKALYQPEERE